LLRDTSIRLSSASRGSAESLLAAREIHSPEEQIYPKDSLRGKRSLIYTLCLVGISSDLARPPEALLGFPVALPVPNFYLPAFGLMEVYKRETRDLINRFFLRQLSFPDCISALDSALAGLIPRLRPEDLPILREVMLANNERVMKEMERRGSPPKTSTAAT
jgi:hypothetical protein